MFGKVLVANRGVIACRILRTLRKMGVASVAVYSEADRHSPHLTRANEAVAIGPSPAAQSYLAIDRILDAAFKTGAEAIHPGYGFLSENADFAEACEDAGLAFIGPTPSQIRTLAAKPGVALPGSVEGARHIGVQIFGDGQGKVLALGERDCSAQRRNRKIIDEAPAPGLSVELRARLFEASVALGEAVRYRSAGTVEFLLDDERGEFYFCEVIPRLQAEHGVTEEITGIDLVEWMVRLAARELPPLAHLGPATRGHSIQVRIYAEDPAKNFQPSAGTLTHVKLPTRARCETWVESGTDITPFYDPMVAKIIVRGDRRETAVRALHKALTEARFDGVETNLHYLWQIASDDHFERGSFSTSYLKEFNYELDALEVIEPGAQTTVQDYPGRTGYWHVGVPPSGPMDALTFRLANRLVGNPDTAAALECAMTGPVLKFHEPAIIAVCGADMGARLNGKPLSYWRPVQVRAGSELRMGQVRGGGVRTYLAVRGGFDVPEYLGSRATFIPGNFGGHGGRSLRAGDLLRWDADEGASPVPGPLGSELIPEYTNEWEIGVLYGPHGAPDFFTDADIEMIFSTSWRVHYNSDRIGVRLIGPKPKWARKDGGEAGLHPSNLHDNAYAVGAMNFTGDMPVLLGPDGPSLGGFVCPATIVHAELWKMGQLKPGDTVRFVRLTEAQAREMERRQDLAIAQLENPLPLLPESRANPEPAICHQRGDSVMRLSGDKHLLIEFGENRLDLDLRFRVHALERKLRSTVLPGIIDIAPGIRSLQIHYDSRVLSRRDLLDAIDAAQAAVPALYDITVPARIVHLPLSWDDPATRLAIEKYMESVRPDAPWCPDNIEFIRRINGLDTIDDVYRTVFDASYLVMALGDAYLGAPVTTPLDPRHRLVTTKYTPARTWTAEDSVGIGGAYMGIDGIQGPGGHQLVGRTIPVWSTYQPQAPWLLRFFDQIRFYPVSAGELVELRDSRFSPRVEDISFSLREHHRFLDSIEPSAKAFKARQQAAFAAERERWAAAGQAEFLEPPALGFRPLGAESSTPVGCEPVRSPITASVWQVNVQKGQPVEAGQRLLVLEAMKMEVAVVAPRRGIVEDLRCAAGAFVTAGQNLVVLRATEGVAAA